MTLLWHPPTPDHVPADRMMEFDFFEVPEGVSDPTDIWHNLVKNGAPPIFYTPKNGGHWVFLKYADIAEAYRNHEIFSTYQTPIPPIEPFPVMMPQGVDPPDNVVFRQLLAPMFTPLAVRRMTEGLQARAQTLIGRFADQGHCDFIRDYAEQFPTGTFLDLFGLPEERLPEFLELANIFFRSTDADVRARNLTDIYAVLDALFREKQANPGQDIASTIVMARDSEGKQHAWNDILNCGFLLFVAGLDTVTNTMAYVWKYLATTPQARDYFIAHMDDTAASMVALEELMRINAVSNLFRRVTRDCEFKGVQFRRNDRVVLPNTVANRDPTVFEDALNINLERKVNNHVTFGVGPHRCMGSHLAKREILVSIQEWLKVIPAFALSEEDGGITPFGGAVMGFGSLKLKW